MRFEERYTLKKAASAILALILMFTMLPATIMANEQPLETPDPSLVFRAENQQIYTNNYTNLNDKVDALKGLEEGTIIVRFRYTGTSIMSLFSLSNSTKANGHFHLYITPAAIGSENRLEAPGQTAVNTHVKADIAVKQNEVHTVAMVVDKNQGYKYFLDGKLVKTDTTSARKFMSNVFEPNSAQLGRTERPTGSNQYSFNGEIDFAEVYSKPLSDQELLAITGVTNTTPVQTPLPEGALITDPYSVYYPGQYGSNAYRIPALLQTVDGTLLAGIDKRISHGGDSPANIDMLVRRSLDNGQTWEENGVLINNYPGNASNIDQSLLQDRETKRIFSLVLGFPDGGGYPTSVKGSGFKTVNGKPYLLLKDQSNNEYTVRENGEVYDSANVKTTYKVDQKRNLYNNDVKVSHIFLPASPLKPIRTSYLELWHSDDEGLTWEGPVDMNPGMKEEWMAFLGAGPGTGIQLTEGDKAGRLVFPVYFTNENSSQASAVIYSDDHGATWHRGESPNEGRIVNGVTLNERTFTGNELTESQVVEMPDGQLKLFMRNYSGFAQIATSFDGGETWDSEVVTERGLPAAYCQMTAIRYDGQIDGKEAVIFASPGSSSSRINGTVKAGLIVENGTHTNGRTKYTFDWKYSQLVKEGHYAYSSLTNLANGEIGLFYEGTGSEQMSFIKFNEKYLKWQRLGSTPEAKLNSIAIESPKPDGYAAKDKLRIKTVYSHYMMLSGDKSLKGTIGDTAVVFQLASQNSSGTEFIFETEFPELAPGSYTLKAAFGENLKAYNAYGSALNTQAAENKLQTQVVSGTTVPQGAATHLTGASEAVSGEAFNIQLGLKNVTQSVYAQDITLLYDAALMEFTSVKSLMDGIQLIETITSEPGKIRFILASAGADHGVTGDAELLELSFKAKDVTVAAAGLIEVATAVLGDELGSETEAAPSSISIEVTPAETGTAGDVNSDGKVSVGDLGIVAAHYGKDSTSPDWEQAKRADINKDNKIDIEDLAAVAKIILE
jgi:sialidase-1